MCRVRTRYWQIKKITFTVTQVAEGSLYILCGERGRRIASRQRGSLLTGVRTHAPSHSVHTRWALLLIHAGCTQIGVLSISLPHPGVTCPGRILAGEPVDLLPRGQLGTADGRSGIIELFTCSPARGVPPHPPFESGNKRQGLIGMGRPSPSQKCPGSILGFVTVTRITCGP